MRRAGFRAQERPRAHLARRPARAALLAAASLVAPLAAVSASAASRPNATAARSMSVRDEGYLRLLRSSGSLLIDEGSAHGSLPGRVNIRFVYDGNPSVSAQIAIYGHAGSIRARGSGRLSSPSSPSPSFKGMLVITGGSGRYAHARGGGSLYGVFYRRSYALTVQTDGTLRY